MQVKQKIKDANALNRYLNLQSRYRYTTLRDCLSPAIQVPLPPHPNPSCPPVVESG